MDVRLVTARNTKSGSPVHKDGLGIWTQEFINLRVDTERDPITGRYEVVDDRIVEALDGAQEGDQFLVTLRKKSRRDENGNWQDDGYAITGIACKTFQKEVCSFNEKQLAAVRLHLKDSLSILNAAE